MVKKMNKKEFVVALSTELSLKEDKCYLISEILENNFFISKKSKDKIIKELIEKLEINSDEATNIYNVAIKIINDEIKNKLKYPFKSKD